MKTATLVWTSRSASASNNRQPVYLAGRENSRVSHVCLGAGAFAGRTVGRCAPGFATGIRRGAGVRFSLLFDDCACSSTSTGLGRVWNHHGKGPAASACHPGAAVARTRSIRRRFIRLPAVSALMQLANLCCERHSRAAVAVSLARDLFCCQQRKPGSSRAFVAGCVFSGSPVQDLPRSLPASLHYGPVLLLRQTPSAAPQPMPPPRTAPCSVCVGHLCPHLFRNCRSAPRL